MQIIKKFIIGLAVLGTFLLYSLGIRHKSPLLNKPSSLATNNTTTTSTSTTNTPTDTSTTATNPSAGQYADGTYTGSVENAYYGNVQVSATISDGKITNVTFLQYPNTHSTSVVINQQAMPYLQQEAIKSQNANVQIVSGATYTSQAFIQSLTIALSKA